jgi:hypothetical protein
MNSRQINFFLTAVDQAALLAHISAKHDFRIIHSLVQCEAPALLSSAEVKEMGVDRLKVYLARPEDLEAVHLNFVPNHNYKTIDVVKSPVIEFVRCYHVGEQLRRGRFYFVTSYYEGGHLVKKERDFINWANGIIVASRRKLIKDTTSSFYFGDDAFALGRGNTNFDKL